MKISPLVFYTVNKNKPLITHFKGLNSPSIDVFERQSVTVKNIILNTEGYPVKNISLKNSKGEDKKGFIMLDKNIENQVFACADGKALCRMYTEDKDDCCFIKELYSRDDERIYKGAGSELIKYAIEQSKKWGHEGKIELDMAGSFPFYFKNNFRFKKEKYPDAIKRNALLDYTTRNKIKIYNIWNENWYYSRISLDKKGADALLKGERYYDSSKSRTLYTKKMSFEKGYVDTDIDFCDLGEDCSAIQLIGKTTDFYHQLGILEFDKNNKIINLEADNEEYKKELLKAFSELKN